MRAKHNTKLAFSFFGKKVFLETHVKVEPDWRSKPHKLKYFGYGGN
jgi:GTP-binding protein Era